MNKAEEIARALVTKNMFEDLYEQEEGEAIAKLTAIIEPFVQSEPDGDIEKCAEELRVLFGYECMRDIYEILYRHFPPDQKVREMLEFIKLIAHPNRGCPLHHDDFTMRYNPEPTTCVYCIEVQQARKLLGEK